MTKEECLAKNLIADIPKSDDCVIKEHTLTLELDGKTRTITCTGSHLDELVRGLSITGDNTSVKAIKPASYKPEQIYGLANAFLAYEGIHSYTSAAHMAILAREDDILCIREDISRHCAIDKVIGFALLNGIDLSGCMIYSSGRVQEDTVKKLVNAGVPMLVSKSVPTYEAIALAKKHGITLIGRAWPDGYKVFT